MKNGTLNERIFTDITDLMGRSPHSEIDSLGTGCDATLSQGSDILSSRYTQDYSIKVK